jgi:hypothetical protein
MAFTAEESQRLMKSFLLLLVTASVVLAAFPPVKAAVLQQRTPHVMAEGLILSPNNEVAAADLGLADSR